MSLECGRLCSIILEDNYGAVARAIGEALFPTSWRSLKSIVAETKLSMQEVTNGLALMIKYHFVVFRVSTVGHKPVVEYSLQINEVLWTIRYPKYIQFMKNKYGMLGEFITCSLVTGGSQTASEIILDCLNYPDVTDDVKEIRKTLREMITQKYFIRLPMVAGQSAACNKANELYLAPVFVNDDDLSFQMPKLNLQIITKVPPEKAKDKDILWRVNNGRFHQEFRDKIIVEAVKNKLGTALSEFVAAILKMIYETDGPWAKDVSNPFSRSALRTYLEANITNHDLVKYSNHYLTLLATDSLGVVRNMNSNTNEFFVVDWARIFLNLTSWTLEELVGQRFGPKARRIFCIVRSKPFIEQSELHKDVMMSDKECKSATYALIKEHFIHIRSVRKVGASGAGHTGISYLFHLKTTKLVQTLMTTCYKSIKNHILRAAAEKKQNHIVMDKIMKVNRLTQLASQNMASQDAIEEANNLITSVDKTHLAKVQNNIIIMLSTIQDIDDTIFQLEMYLYHSAKVQLVNPCIQFNIS